MLLLFRFHELAIFRSLFHCLLLVFWGSAKKGLECFKAARTTVTCQHWPHRNASSALEKGRKRGRLSTSTRPPPHVTEALLARERFTVWEPACGNGAMSRVLEKKLPHCKIVSSDICDYGYGRTGVDFLETHLKVDGIITNPPFKFAYEFAVHALECADKVALFLRLQFLEGTKRYSFFRKFPPKTVYVFSRRATLSRNGVEESPNAGLIAFAWFVWQKNYLGAPQLDWILKNEREPSNGKENDHHNMLSEVP